MIRKAEAIKKISAWNNSIDVISIKILLCEKKYNDDLHNAMVEEKKDRTIHKKDVIERKSKKKSPKNKEAFKEEKLEKMLSSTDFGSASLSKE